MTQDSDSPVGFGSSMKLDCTTAKSSLDAGSYLYILHRIEAQDLQQLGYGTSSPQAITLSFWVKSPKTGTHYTELYHGDSSGSTKRKNSYAYTVSTANTWEKKSMTFAGDTGVNAIVNDTGWGLMIIFYLATGSNMTSGTNTNDNWHNTEANRTPNQVNCADSTSNNFYLTGIQFELGSTATDFEHRSYGEELALCQRYYQILVDGGADKAIGVGFYWSSNEVDMHHRFDGEMRAAPTLDHVVGTDYYRMSSSADSFNGFSGIQYTTTRSCNMYISAYVSGTAGYTSDIRSRNADSFIAFTAEL